MSGTDEPWYEPVEANLEQGDVLVDFPVLHLDYDGTTEKPIVRAQQGTLVVLTQSCDIMKESQRDLLLVHAFPYWQAVEGPSGDSLRARDGRKALRQGTTIGEFLLPPSESFSDYMVVGFHNLVLLPKSYVLARVGDRSVRLRSPYKEHFAQAYGRFMMRVGLPHGLDEFEDWVRETKGG